MAARVLSHIRRTSVVNSLFQNSLGSRTSPSSWGASYTGSPIALRKEISQMTSDMSRLFSSVGFTQRSLSSSPSFGSIVPHRQSSVGIHRLSPPSRSFSTGGLVPNMRAKFSKQRRNRGEMKGTTQNHISFGKYGLECLEPAWITQKQITAGTLAIKRNMKGGKLFLRIFPHKPVSLRPAEVRMGRGKGNVAFWVAGVRAGRILFEIDGVPESVARRAIAVAASKMPIKTRFVKSLG